MMKDEIMQVIDYREDGFKPLLSFEDWRVAGLNYTESSDVDAQQYQVERHLQTDEVFILTEGQAWLLVGDNSCEYGTVQLVPMDQGVVYNIRMGTWHGTIMAPGARILLVEKKDTGTEQDTVRVYLPQEIRDNLRMKILK